MPNITLKVIKVLQGQEISFLISTLDFNLLIHFYNAIVIPFYETDIKNTVN